MPDFAAVDPTAICADDSAGEDVGGEVLLYFAPLHFQLDQVPFIWIDDGRVAASHVVLWHLAFIDLHGLRQIIRGEGFLEKGIAFVLLVLQDRLDCGFWPYVLAARCLDIGGYGADG